MSSSNIQLSNYCEQLNIPCAFIGDSKDFKIIEEVPMSYILLLNGNNSHWVAVYCTSSWCYYFDSFGEFPNKETENEILKYYMDYTFNLADIQKITSGNCGLFVIDFLNYMHNFHGKPSDKKFDNFVKSYYDYNS